MITVLLPAYNNSGFIESAVDTILNQTFTDFELLIIDDCSDDDTADKIEKIKDSRIRLIKNKENLGLGSTLNLGLNLAKYNLIARMDGDDISLPERLSVQYNYMLNNKSVDVLSSHYAMMYNGKIRYTVKTSEEHKDIKRKLILHSEIMHPCVMYRKEVILKYGGYKNIYAEDYELWLRIKDNAVFHNIPETLLIKRYHEKSISLDSEKRNSSVYSYTEKYYSDPCGEFGIGISEENIFRGWREYFYGDKRLARKYFLQSFPKLLKSPRAALAYFFTFLSIKRFNAFREFRLRFRLAYYLNYFSFGNIKARKFARRYKAE